MLSFAQQITTENQQADSKTMGPKAATDPQTDQKACAEGRQTTAVKLIMPIQNNTPCRNLCRGCLDLCDYFRTSLHAVNTWDAIGTHTDWP